MPVQLDIDMPKSCDECPFSQYTGIVRGKFLIYACRLLNMPLRINADNIIRHSKCPLKEIKQ